MKQGKWFAVTALMMLALSQSAARAEPHCSPTATVPIHHYPGAAHIPPTNNLTLPTGKATPVEGQRVVVTGHLLDSRCIPIPDAVIELWQTDPYGQWYLAEGADLASANPVFAGAGRTVTNADGQFTFITVFPGSPKPTRRDPRATAPSAPQINLRVLAPNFAQMNTVLFFQNDRRNATDPVYKKISIERRSGITLRVQPGDGELNASVDLVLPGQARYRSY